MTLPSSNPFSYCKKKSWEHFLCHKGNPHQLTTTTTFLPVSKRAGRSRLWKLPHDLDHWNDAGPLQTFIDTVDGQNPAPPGMVKTL